MPMNAEYRRPIDLPATIPVFPLPGALLLPRGQMPLNIFEPRYLAMIDDASRALRQMAEVAGLTIRMPPSGSRLEGWAYRAWRRKVVSASGAFLPGSAIHELGGAAMGRDCATSVVDAWGRCWDARNVFVTDGACFASGCSQNVTLTIMALTVRACDRLASELRAGAL